MTGLLKPYRHILASVDGSRSSLHALEEALGLPGCRVTAAAVVPPLPGGFKDAGPEAEALFQAPYDKALAACRDLAASRNQSLETLMLRGEPHEALSAAAKEQRCDLVVVGKRGQDLPSGALMGKVTERVIGYCPLDVLVVPEGGSVSFERLLLPVDGSRFSRQAAARTLALAGSAGGAALLVVAVLDAPQRFVTEVPEVARDLLDSLEKLVAGVARQAADRALPCETRVVVGPAAPTVVELAQKWPAGLIVMGSHGRTGLKRLLMGSVTERVVGEAPCPVLVVKGDQRP